MKLVFLYGPPAVGKLTVANELATLSRFKIFHNHLSVDLVESIFPRGTRPFAQLIWDIRLSTFAKAAEEDIDGLIFTMVYGRNREALMSRCVDVVEKAGGEVCFVHLTCSQATLERRVRNEDRKRHGKITSVDVLRDSLSNSAAQEPFAASAGWKSLTIDTDTASPLEAAQQIVTHYGLATLE
jgi:hypothetical protein